MGKILKKEVGKYDQNNNLIISYKCAAEAAEKNDVSIQTIDRYIKSEKLWNGCVFKYTGNIIESDFYENSNSKNVILDLNKKVNLDIWEKRECPICHRFFYARKKYKKLTCSKECYEEYVKNNKEEINNKRKISNYNAYHKKSKEEIILEHEKSRKTCLERYGVDSYQKTQEYKDKMSKLFLEKDWTERTKKNTEKLIVKYKQICENDDVELLKFNNRFDCICKCKKCGNIFTSHVLGYLSEATSHNICKICYPIKYKIIETKPYKFIENILNEYKIEYTSNYRSLISPFEVDIYIPSFKIAFEINGNYWHSEISGEKDKKYHLNKTILCEDKGVKLIHIFEDEIINKPEIVKSRVLNILGLTSEKIYARKCNIKTLTYKEKKDFFNENHIDGDSISKYAFGLEYEKEIVCAVSFGNRKISGKEQFEIIRFASKLNTNVVGGFSKLISYFIKNYNPSSIITYADIRWSGINHEENVYIKNGFKFIKNTEPNYFYEDKKKYIIRLNRLNFTKQKLIKRGYDKNKTEIQIMIENGYDRIWDCGSMKFEYKKEGL